MTPKAQTNYKNRQIGLHPTLKHLWNKGNNQQSEKAIYEQEKVFENNISDVGLFSRISEEHL